MENVMKDKRFAHIARDPRFRSLPKRERKVQIDQRFKSMFDDKRFKLKYSVDKRGRPINLTSNENLRKFYDLADSEESSDEQEDAEPMSGSESSEETSDKNEGSKSSDSGGDEDAESDEESSDSSLDEQIRKKQTKSKTKTRQKLKDIKDKTEKKAKRNETVQKKGKSKSDKRKSQKQLAKAHKQRDDDSLEDNTTDESGDDSQKDLPGVDSGIDFARGEGLLASSSDEDEEEEEEDTVNNTGEEDKDGEFDHRWGEQDEKIEKVDESTSRLAICNMDWDRIKARDLFVLLNSFKPASGAIKSVSVYPSEFGLARMEEERLQGPKELHETLKTNAESTEGTKYHTEKLRQYQLNRLKYYYAVAECDTTETANSIYEACDGTEYESSATKMDLRFIPEDMQFEQAAMSVCTEQPNKSVYKPSLFFNTALSQSKVELTWDETDRERLQATQKPFTSSRKEDIAEDDLKAYLASSSDEEGPNYGSLLGGSDSESEGEEEEDEDKKIEKYKRLVQDLESKESKKDEQDVQMEITWEPGLREATEEILKKKKTQESISTPWEGYLEKKKDKKRKKREEKKKKREKKSSSKEDDTTNAQEEAAEAPGEAEEAFSDDELPAGIDLSDPFFAEELGQPTSKSKSKKDKKKKKKETPEDEEERKKREAELSLLLMDEEDKKKHFSLKKLIEEPESRRKKRKQKKEKEKSAEVEDDFKINVSDERFAAVYDSHLFNIDPSAPEFKKTKGTEAMIVEKLKRRVEGSAKKHKLPVGNIDSKHKVKAVKRKGGVIDEPVPKSKAMSDGTSGKDKSLASLVQSVKMKTQQFQAKKHR